MSLARVLAIILLVSAPTTIHAEEQFLFFISEARVLDDGTVLVTENMRVQGEGKDFKRGIIRSLPQKVIDTQKKVREISYELIQVSRNDVELKASTESKDGNFRIKMGEEKVFLPPGIYNFNLRYKIKNAIIPGDQSEKLYLDVTGVLPVHTLQAQAVVYPPALADPAGVKVQGFIRKITISGNKGELTNSPGILTKVSRDAEELNTLGEHKPKIETSASRPLEKGESYVLEMEWTPKFVNAPRETPALPAS